LMQQAHNSMKQKLDKIKYFEKHSKRPDWEAEEELLGEEQVTKKRLRKEYCREANRIKYDEVALEARFKEHCEPIRAERKDKFVELFPFIKQMADRCVNMIPLLELDSYGLPVKNFNDPRVIDAYFPDIRDAILMEIENDDYSYNIKKEVKKLPISSIEDIGAMVDHKWIQKLNEYEEKELQKHLRPAQSGKQESETQKKLARLFIEVQEAVEVQKKIETEISVLKSQVESASEQETVEKDDKDKKEVVKKEVKKMKTPGNWIEEAVATGEYVIDEKTGLPVKFKPVPYVPEKYRKIREESLARQKAAMDSKKTAVPQQETEKNAHL